MSDARRARNLGRDQAADGKVPNAPSVAVRSAPRPRTAIRLAVPSPRSAQVYERLHGWLAATPAELAAPV
jgi:hypothetical protein